MVRLSALVIVLLGLCAAQVFSFNLRSDDTTAQSTADGAKSVASSDEDPAKPIHDAAAQFLTPAEQMFLAAREIGRATFMTHSWGACACTRSPCYPPHPFHPRRTKRVHRTKRLGCELVERSARGRMAPQGRPSGAHLTAFVPSRRLARYESER